MEPDDQEPEAEGRGDAKPEPVVRNDSSGPVGGNLYQGHTITVTNVHTAVRGFDDLPEIRPSGLPQAPEIFVNRVDKMAELTALVTKPRKSGAALVAIGGLGGVGKSALVAWWGNQVAGELFPDGTMHVNLGTHRANGGVGMNAAFAQLLGQCGCEDWQLAKDLPGRREQLRARLRGKRVLLVADDVNTDAEVAQLRPENVGSALIITGHGGGEYAMDQEHLSVEPLDDASAFELVSILIGSGEAEAERAEVTELVRLCGGVPKVIGIAVGPVRRHDSIRIADVLAGLRTELDGAEGPVDQDSILGMVADRAYHSLTPEAARLYRALSWHPEGDVSKHAILALARHPSGNGEPPLIDLLEHHLLEPLQTDRYKLSYLVRAHARRHAISVDGPRAERETLKALASWYAAWAHSADKTMIPNRTRVFATEPSRRPPFATGDDKDENKRDARDWFEAERYNLLAIQRRCFDEGWYDLVMRLGESMWVMYIGGRYLEDWLDSSRLAVTAAVDSGHPAAEVRFRAFLARALMENAAIATEPDRLFDEAARELTRARELPMADGIGPDLRASAIEFTGRWYSYKGQYREAIDCYRQAMPLFASQAEQTDLPEESRRASQRGVTLQLHFIGRCLLKLGDLTGAAEHLRQAESRMVGTDHDRDVATIRTDLGETLRRLGRLDEAFAVVTAAVDVLAYQKWYRIEISALRQLALIAEARGDTELERTCLERLRDLYAATHDTELSAVEERLRRL